MLVAMKFTPLRIAVLYFAIAIVWITTTDHLVEELLTDMDLLIVIQTVKGYFFVGFTAIFLYWMLKRFEGSLKSEQELQSKILSSIPVMIAVYRPNLSEITVNREFENVTGWSNSEFTSAEIVKKTHPNDKEEQNKVLEFMRHPDRRWEDFEITTRDGHKIQTTWTNVRLSDDMYLGIGLDITERKKIEEQLKRNEEWLQLTTTSSNIGLWEWHPKTGKAIFDETWAKLLGYTLEELQPVSEETWYELIHPEDLANYQKEMDKYFEGRAPIYECEARMKHKEGHWVWVLDRGRAVEWDEEGNPTRLVGIHLDIAYRKNIEERIETERRRFEIAANITSDVIWEWNPQTGELWWGEGVESVFGYKKAEYEGDPDFWKNHIAEYDKERVLKSMQRAEESNASSWSAEYDFIAANGSVKKIKDSAVILRDKKGSLNRIIGAMVDRTRETEYREALKHQSYRFEMIAKTTNDVLYEWNLKTDQVWWSEGWQTRFDYSEDEIESTLEWWTQKIHPDDREKVMKSLTETASINNEYWVEYYRIKNGKGSYSNVVDRGYFIKNDNGENEYMVGTISDITADVKAKEELKASEEQYRLLFEQNPIPMFIYDPETYAFSTANQAALENYGYTKEELLNMTVLEIRPKSGIEEVKRMVAKHRESDMSTFSETTHLTKNGKKLTVEIYSSGIFYKGKHQRLVIANDITEQRKAEERAISAIVEGEERERQRVAKELHDGLGQYLSASNMNLKSVYEDLDDIPENLSSAFKTGLEFLNHAISETRNISQNLLPKAIQDYGLELAAESLISHLRNNNDIEFFFYKKLDDVTISDSIQINLYRILQEALNNAIKHGNPTKIDVQLVYSDNEILMTVEDNGKGFDKDRVESGGIGIRSMKTRVGAMSANLDIVSNKGRGTIVSVVVPVN